MAFFEKLFWRSLGSLCLSIMTLTVSMPPAHASYGLSLGLGIVRVAVSSTRTYQYGRRYGRFNYGATSNQYGNAGDCSGYQSSPAYDLSTGACAPFQFQQNSNENLDARSRSAIVKRRNLAVTACNKGNRLWEQHEADRAQKEFSEALKYDPDMPEAHYGLALVYMDKLAYAECLAEVEQSLAKDKKDADYLFMAGHACARLHKYSEARRYFKRYLTASANGVNADIARESVAIIENSLLDNAEGDYLSDATNTRLARWESSQMPLKVFIKEDDTMDGYTSEYKTVLKEAFEQWQSASRGKVSFEFTDKAENAQITCGWTDDQSKLGSQELGLTGTTIIDSHRIEAANIQLFTLCDRKDVTAEERIAKMKEVSLHEIGHALGLGHSQQVYDIMYFRTCPEGLEFPLTERDSNTVVALYSKQIRMSDTSAMETDLNAGRGKWSSSLAEVQMGQSGNP